MRLISAVFTKEMVTLSRRKSQYAARALLLGALVAVIWFSWHGIMPGAGSFADMSEAVHDLFWTFATVQTLAAAILTPAFTAPVIATEKDRKTLGLLLMSNLTLRQILLDKVLSRLAVMFLLILSGLPLFLVLLPFGGITAGEIATLYSATAGIILFCAGAGLFFSTVSEKMHTALIATYSFVFAYALTANLRNIIDTHYTLFYGTVLFTLSILICILILPRLAERERKSRLKRLFRQLNLWFRSINFTGVTVMKEHKVPDRNAMLWKETHKQFYSSNIFLLRAFAVLLVISTLAVAPVALFGFNIMSFFEAVTLLGLLITYIVTIIGSSIAFASERENHTLDAILTTPMVSEEIVAAKFLGALKLSLPPITCTAVWIVIGSCFYGLGTLAFYVGLLAFTIPLIITTGLHASLKRRRASAALLQTFLTFSVICLLPVFFSAIYYTVYPPTYLGDLNIFTMILFDPEGILSLTSTIIHTSEIGFVVLFASLILSPVWIIPLSQLTRNFDRITGRQ